jgi:hypothetical protein
MPDVPTKEVSARKPPFLSFTTLANFLDQFVDSTVPSHIDKSIFPSSMSGGNQVYLQSALKYLGLVSDSNVPQPEFHALVAANEEDRARIWNEILHREYAFLLKDIEIDRATTRIVVDRFKEVGMGGDTIRKAMTFFLHAAKAAKMTVSPHVKAPRPVQPAHPKTPKEKKVDTKTGDGAGAERGAKNDPRKTEEKTGNPTDPPYQVLIKILNNDMTEEEQDAVWTLIRYLKKQE